MSILASAEGASRDQALALCRHLQQCHAARGRWFALAMLAERVHALLAPRFATTVALVSLLLFITC